jgi:hypothetical protein
VKDIGGSGLAARWRVVDSIVVRGARTRGLWCDMGCDRSWGNRKASRAYCRSSRQSSLGDSGRDLLPEIRSDFSGFVGVIFFFFFFFFFMGLFWFEICAGREE